MPARRPRILLPTPTSSDGDYNDRCLKEYVVAVEQSGGEALVLPLTAHSPKRAVLRESSGILLPGSPADWNPARYGQVPGSSTATPDLARERLDLELLDGALESGVPVLGICFGLQSVNVWRGGSLVQDVRSKIDHAVGPQVQVAHAVTVEAGSRLSELGQSAESEDDSRGEVWVNSSHHQAVERLGADLRVTARSTEDDVVEALEWALKDAPFPLLAVQWHPERSFESSQLSRGMFAWLVQHRVHA